MVPSSIFFQVSLISALMLSATLFSSNKPEEIITAFLSEIESNLNEYSFTLYKDGDFSMNAGERFQLNQGSLSKIFSTLLIVRLEKTGVLSLQDKVGEYLTDDSYAPFLC